MPPNLYCLSHPVLTSLPAIPPRRPQRQRRAILLHRKGPQATQKPLPTNVRRHQRHRNDHIRQSAATNQRRRPVEARERWAEIRRLGPRRPSEFERGREVAEEVRKPEDEQGWELNRVAPATRALPGGARGGRIVICRLG